MAAYGPRLANLAKTAKSVTLAGMQPRAETFPLEGVTIQVETVDSLIEGGQHLFVEHLLVVGESPDSWRSKNHQLMREAEKIGALRVFTARSNGRMFGYLMQHIAPSLQTSGVQTAVHGLFYASPLIPGLGRRLQRAAV
jgi:hypothetical protein